MAKSRLKAGTAAAALCCAVIGGFEGLRLVAYQDIVGVWTQCYGDTRHVDLERPATKAECDARLLEEIIAHEKGMLECVRSDLPIKVHIAFVSATYNIGVANFCRSSMARLANAGELERACDALLKWNIAGGRVIRGLSRRRTAERELCLEGLQ